MGDALRRLFLAIGIGLGLAPGQPDPGLVARLLSLPGEAAGDRVAVSARVENAFAPGAMELVEAGTSVALRFSAEAQSSSMEPIHAEETRALRFDLRTGRYSLSLGRGRRAALVDPQAARDLVSELTALELCGAADLAQGARVVVRAEIGLLDSGGAWHDAPVLWNYLGPRAVLGWDGGH
jgi:hypothetical protein